MASAEEVMNVFAGSKGYHPGGWIAPSNQIQHLSPGNQNMYKRIRDAPDDSSRGYGPNGPMMPGELTQDELEALEKAIANLERVIVVYGEDHVVRKALTNAYKKHADHLIIEKKYGPNCDTAKRSPGVQLKPAQLIELDDTEA